jgi:Rieske Fe-S protein
LITKLSLGGILQWNADEKTFDCPMHGSRFTNEGTVINGPATSDLKKSLLTKNLKFKVNTGLKILISSGKIN